MATQAEIEALAVRKEIEANLRAQAAGFSDAAARERDANRRSIEAGFTSAVDQEIDANRRAREAGFLNAAVKENPAAAAPGTSIYSTAPFVDPRSPVASRIPATPTAPRRPAGGGYGAGTLNNAMPSFQGPSYYNQMFNRPLQNWSQFMPANSRLAGGGGALYQNPWGYGTGGGSGWGGAFGGGGMMGGGYPGGGFIGGGGYPGGGPFPGGSWFPGGGGGNTTTDASGNQWVMSSSGQWVPAGSEYGQGLLGDARLFDSTFYDSSGNYIGAEGDMTDVGTPWQDTIFAPLGYKMGIDFAGYNPGQGQDTGSSYEDYEDTDIGFMQDANTGYSPTTGGRVHSGPLAYSDTSGYSFSGGPLADKQAYMGGTISPYGDPLANVNALPTVSPIFDPSTSNSWSGPYVNTGGTGDPLANTGGLRHSNVNANVWSAPSMTPTAPTYSGGDPAVVAANQAMAAQAQAQAQALAQQQAYDQNVAIGADPDVGAEIDWGGGPDDFM